MSGGGAAWVAVPLRDGTELRVTPEGVHASDRLYEIARIQDARQVSPDPVTIALRVAGAGMVEFQPARPEDGMVALEAIFRLRPDIRPAGFEPAVAVPPTFPPPVPPGAPYPSGPGSPIFSPYPPPGFPPAPGMPYPSVPPAGYAPPYGPQPAPMRYGPSPNSVQGELTPVPRSFGETLSAIFQLYGKHFGAWLRLGFWVVLLPLVLIGAVQVAGDIIAGTNPLAVASVVTTSSVGGSNCTLQLPALTTGDPLVAGAFAGGTFLLGLLAGAWRTGAYAFGGRDAVLGRKPAAAASVGNGTRRYFPTLGATVFALVCSLVWMAPGGICLGLAVSGLNGANVCDSQTLVETHTTAAALDCIGFLLFVPGLVATIFFGVRLALAPFISATEPIGPVRALRRSWQLTRGNWWRMFFVLLIIVVMIAIAIALVTGIAAVLPAANLLVVSPLMWWLFTPLLELACMVLLMDARLRREGYAAVAHEDEAPVGTARQAAPPVG